MKQPRSWLFVPGDSGKKQEKALTSGADALILCLEDSVTEANKPEARTRVTGFLKEYSGACQSNPSLPSLWVRVNALHTEHLLQDLVAVMAGKPRGIFLPKPSTARDFRTVDNYLTALEVQQGIQPGSTHIMSVAESAVGTLNQHQFPQASKRLQAITWGAEDMSADLGASTNIDDNGDYFLVHRMNRANCLVVAAAGKLQPVDGICSDFRDSEKLRSDCVRSRKEGFTGKIAIHPAQVSIINECFTPSPDDIVYAQQVVQAFAEADGAGTVGLQGKMLDIPHLRQAQRVLSLATEVDSQ